LHELICFFVQKEYVVHKEGLIVISGASSGIGKDAAITLAKQGFHVYAGVRSQKDVDKLVSEGKELKIEKFYVPVILDVTKEETIKSLREKVISSGIPLVAVINNAGITGRYPVESTNISFAKNMFEINYFGAISLTQYLLPMIRKNNGRILFVSSVAAFAWVYGSSTYAGTKRAVEALVDGLRLEMSEFGVSVTSIQPGYIRTNIEAAGITTPETIGISEEQVKIYGRFWNKSADFRKKAFATAPGPEVTSAVILEAITNPYPKTRYVVGPATRLLSGSQLSKILPFIPERLVDYISLRDFFKDE